MLRGVVTAIVRVALAFFLFLGPAFAFQVAEPQVATAQDPSDESEDPAESRATEFRAVEGPEAEDVPGGALLIGAYAIVWCFLMVYVLRLGKLQTGLARDMERLERSLKEASSRGDGEGGE